MLATAVDVVASAGIVLYFGSVPGVVEGWGGPHSYIDASWKITQRLRNPNGDGRRYIL